MHLLRMIFSIICLSGCYQIRDDEDLRVVPVTNNPTIIPNRGGPFPFPSM